MLNCNTLWGTATLMEAVAASGRMVVRIAECSGGPYAVAIMVVVPVALSTMAEGVHPNSATLLAIALMVGGVALASAANDGRRHIRVRRAARPKVFASLVSLAALPAGASAWTENLDSVEALIVALVVVITVLPAIPMCWRFLDSLRVIVQDGTNDDDTAASMFIDIFKRAQSTLVIYDDGNKMDGTIYEDPRVIAAVQEHLANNKELSVRCLFNDEDDLALVRTMRAEYPDRFEVWYRRSNRPLADVHYKIADEGAVGHISQHQHGQPERRFKLLDCTKAKPKTRRVALGEYLARFESDIEDDAVAAT